MMYKLSRGVGLLLVIAVVLLPSVARAQQIAGQGLEISPPLFNLKANPGQVLRTEFRIRNVTDQPLLAKAQYNDFVAGDKEDGNPRILLDSSSEDPSPYTIKGWISTIGEVIIRPNEQKTIQVTISVPKDASPGGHYGVIRFTGTTPEVDSSSVTLSASVGTLMLITVSGDVQDNANILELFTSQNNKKRSLFEYGPITITTRFENKGNVHEQPSGTVAVFNTFGKRVGEMKFNDSKSNVLPKSIRRFENTLDKKLLFGRYKVQADLVYGPDKTIISKTAYFWVIPYKLITLALAVVLLLYFGLRQYNRMIINRAKQGSGDGTKVKSSKSKK